MPVRQHRHLMRLSEPLQVATQVRFPYVTPKLSDVDAVKANSADLLSLRVELASSNCDLMASHPDHQGFPTFG